MTWTKICDVCMGAFCYGSKATSVNEACMWNCSRWTLTSVGWVLEFPPNPHSFVRGGS
jgi:hypothetical protein